MSVEFVKAGSPVYTMVCALCQDYERRAEALAERSEDMATLLTYQYMNEVIDRAIASVCESGIREAMRYDIGNHVGLSRTKILYISDGTYKARKRKTIEAIAKELHLI
jgi:hypothetical protein